MKGPDAAPVDVVAAAAASVALVACAGVLLPLLLLVLPLNAQCDKSLLVDL